MDRPWNLGGDLHAERTRSAGGVAIGPHIHDDRRNRDGGEAGVMPRTACAFQRGDVLQELRQSVLEGRRRAGDRRGER